MNNSIGGVKNRRARTLQRLENQLISGVKITKGDVTLIIGINIMKLVHY